MKKTLIILLVRFRAASERWMDDLDGKGAVLAFGRASGCRQKRKMIEDRRVFSGLPLYLFLKEKKSIIKWHEKTG